MAKDSTARQFKIMDLFKRGEVLDKAQIEELLGIDKNSGTGPSQALARDLNDLFEQAKLVKKYYQGDGTELSEDEAESAKFKTIKWSLPGLSHNILGKGLLTSAGGELFLSSRLAKDISIRELNLKDLDQGIGLIFDLGPILRMKFSWDILPLSVIICRNSDDLTEKIFADLEVSFSTKRLVLLALPDKNISSAVSCNKPGHVYLEFIANDQNLVKVKCRDLGSKNGTWISNEVSAKDFKERLASALSTTNQTRNLKEEASKTSQIKFEKLGSGFAEKNLPIYLNLADLRIISIS